MDRDRTARGRDAAVWLARGELRFAPGGRADRRARASGGRSRATTRRSICPSAAGRCAAGDYPDALAPAVVGAELPARGRRARVGRARLRVRRLGRLATTWAAAATGRCTAATRSGVLLMCGVGRRAARRRGRSGRSRTSTPLVLDHFGVGLMPASERARARTRACATACATATTGCSWSSSAPSAARATWSTSPSSPCAVESSRTFTTWWRRPLAFVVAVPNNFWWNRHWTFGARDGHAGFQAARFFAVSVGGLPVRRGRCSRCWCTRAGVPEIAAQAISIVGGHAAQLRREQDVELRAALTRALSRFAAAGRWWPASWLALARPRPRRPRPSCARPDR